MTEVGTVSQELVLGKTIAAARKAAGFTQQDLCAKADLSYSTLAKIERGAIKSPSVFTVAAIAAATGTSVEQLTGVASGIVATPALPQIDYKTAKNGVQFVYFDINGVMVRFFQRAFTAISADTGVSPDSVEAIFWHYNDAVCRGDMSLEEFNIALAQRLGVPNISWAQYYLANLDPIHEMHECAAWASEHFKIGLLSNIMPGLISEMLTMGLLPNLPYTAIVDSSQVGAIKPEPAVYEKATQMAGVPPESILLIDDGRTNLMAAERMGWHVIWFDSYRSDESEQRVKSALEF
jgi:FMN phosphatase YigB (HAD superfamily)